MVVTWGLKVLPKGNQSEPSVLVEMPQAFIVGLGKNEKRRYSTHLFKKSGGER
jgi:hypothetical protein